MDFCGVGMWQVELMVFVCGGVGDVVGCADRAADGRRGASLSPWFLGTSCFWGN